MAKPKPKPKPKKFAMTVSLYVRDREVLQSLADEHQMSLSKFGAQLINQNREILIRAREAEAKVAEVENAAFSHMKNAHRLLGIMFRALRETMPSVRKVQFDLLWDRLMHSQPGDQFASALDMVAQFVQLPTEKPVEVAENGYIN